MRKYALITGAAHRMGKAIAIELAQAGYDICLHYRSVQAQADATKAEIESLGRAVQLFKADLADDLAIQHMFNEISHLDGRLEAVVNSAGVMPRGDLKSLQLADWQATLAVNLTAPFLVGQLAYQQMKASGGGVIINITDVGAEKAWSGYADYTVSKAGLAKLTELQARSYAPEVRVNAIAPGLIAPDDDFDRDKWQALVNKTPLKKQGDFAYVAKTVRFLIENEFITGETLHVDGGYRLI